MSKKEKAQLSWVVIWYFYYPIKLYRHVIIKVTELYMQFTNRILLEIKYMICTFA